MRTLADYDKELVTSARHRGSARRNYFEGQGNLVSYDKNGRAHISALVEITEYWNLDRLRRSD